MNLDKIKNAINNNFGKKILVLVYLDGKYYFGLENDSDLNYTMNTRFFDPKLNKFDVFNGMDDIPRFKMLQKLAKEKNLASSL